jgi:adenosylmethionine-8-amino-7-oxononanoate aminotransferase
MPFSAVLSSEDIYQVFYDDYPNGKSFLHSNTYSGNVLAASIANEVFNIYEEENICDQANLIGKYMLNAMHEIASNNNKITNVRGIGAIVAADLTYRDDSRRIAFEIYQKAVKMGALLRPLGDTIYWLPPLNMNLDTLEELKNITMQALIDTKF